jgi:hypothetical protein
MALDIDGFAVFRSIGANRAAFAAIAADILKAAQTLAVKAIRDKKTGLAELRAIRQSLSAEAFNLITDGMPDSQIKSLAARLDKHNSEVKGSEAAAQRRHVMALAEGTAEPMEKRKAAPKPKAPKKLAKKQTPERIHFDSTGATRKR